MTFKAIRSLWRSHYRNSCLVSGLWSTLLWLVDTREVTHYKTRGAVPDEPVWSPFWVFKRCLLVCLTILDENSIDERCCIWMPAHWPANIQKSKVLERIIKVSILMLNEPRNVKFKLSIPICMLWLVKSGWNSTWSLPVNIMKRSKSWQGDSPLEHLNINLTQNSYCFINK